MNLQNAVEIAGVVAETALPQWNKAADGAAATATAETVIAMVGPGAYAIAIGSIQFAPAAALTADPTNNATITVAKRTAGGAPVTLAVGVTAASGANSTGSWVAWTPVKLTVVAGSTVAPGDVITLTIAKGGTGVVVPQGQLGIFPTTL